MADITNPQAVRISNERMRPLADRLGQLYNFCKALQAEGEAEGWGAMFPNTQDKVIDGSATDGRTPIVSADVNGLIVNAVAFITWMEENAMARRNLVLKVAVNPSNI